MPANGGCVGEVTNYEVVFDNLYKCQLGGATYLDDVNNELT